MNDLPEGPLKRGWTTGACAAAGTRAAFTALLDGEFPDPVTITLPGGQSPSFPLARHRFDGDTAEVSIVKDAGDDPDVTHGALVVVRARLDQAGRGVSFKGGEGVGTVTREGLVLDIGEPAINPGPRRMIKAEIEDVASVHTVIENNNWPWVAQLTRIGYASSLLLSFGPMAHTGFS